MARQAKTKGEIVNRIQAGLRRYIGRYLAQLISPGQIGVKWRGWAMPQGLRERRLLGRVARFDFAGDFAGVRFVVGGNGDSGGAIVLHRDTGFDVALAQRENHHVGKIAGRPGPDFYRGIVRRFVFPVAVLVVEVGGRLVVLGRNLHVRIHVWIVGIVQSYLNDFLRSFIKLRCHADAVAIFDILNDLKMVLDDLVRDFGFTQVGAIHYAVFLIIAGPDLLQG